MLANTTVKLYFYFYIILFLLYILLAGTNSGKQTKSLSATSVSKCQMEI